MNKKVEVSANASTRPPWHSLWQATSGKVGRSTCHYKQASVSLRWDWTDRAPLRRAGLVLDPPAQPQSGMTGWIYCEQPIDGRLTFRLGPAGGEAAYTFRFGLDYTGWRAFQIQFLVDAVTERQPTAIDWLEIIPPTDSGAIYLDEFEFSATTSPHRSADFQIPEHPGDKGTYWHHWTLHYARQTPSEPLPDRLSPEQEQAIAAIRARYETWLLGDLSDPDTPLLQRGRQQTQAYIELGWRSYGELELKVDEAGRLTGPALFMRKGQSTFHHVFYNVLLPLVFDYKRNGNADALTAALLVFDYVHDQGWAEGSANQELMLNVLVFAPYCHAVYLLQDELRATGRFEQAWRAALWYQSFGKSFSCFDERYIETNADELRSTLFTALVMVLAMEAGPRQVQYLRSWLNGFNDALRLSPRFTGLIKPDGLGYHHQGVYAGAYATEAYQFCSLAAYLLHGTEFAVAPHAMENLKLALLTQDALTHGHDVPYTLMGRMPHCGLRVFAAYAWLAMACDPVDPELAGIFMRLWQPDEPALQGTLGVDLDGQGGKFLCKDTPGRLHLLQAFARQGLPASPPPSGFWSKPWGALAIHRRDDWMVAVKGWSQYVWDFEMHPKSWAAREENVYARYWSYGTLQPFTHGPPPTPIASGWALDKGWDYCRWPGATSPHLSQEELYDPATSWACRFFSAASFVGGVESGGRNGLFALKLHEHYYDPTFRAYKTYFFFDDAIICLGSNIHTDDRDHATTTTLFQCHLPEEHLPLQLDGETIEAFPWQWEGEANQPATLIDPYGNGYVVPDSGQLRLARRTQHSREHNNRFEASGAFATCWFDHGHGPQDDGFGEVRYHYAMLMQTTPGQLAAFAAAPSYRVLQQNHQAHILEHLGEATMAYALFETDWIIPHGHLRRNDLPVLVMIREEPNGLLLSVADPDLHLPKRRNMGYLDAEANRTLARESRLRLQLRGAWRLADGADAADVVAGASQTESATDLLVTCRYGLTREFRLIPA